MIFTVNNLYSCLSIQIALKRLDIDLAKNLSRWSTAPSTATAYICLPLSIDQHSITLSPNLLKTYSYILLEAPNSISKTNF